MADFSDLTSKLNQPTKKSHFEQRRAEAEAKKEREKAETAAVLAEFEKSFDDGDDAEGLPQPASVPRGAPAPGKRHFTATSLKSGPGSLGSSFNKKRHFDDYAERRDAPGYTQADRRVSRNEDDREVEKAAKPTLHLASMPPGSSAIFIKGLFANTPLNVDHVRLMNPSSQNANHNERKSSSAIVTLAAETPASDIDTVVSHLQNKYMGFGFKLSISRHLSSVAVGNAALSTGTNSGLPFGARQIIQHTSLSRAPPPGQRFAPPTSYTSSTPYSRGPPTQVTVQSPSDLKQLKLIHKTLEALLTYGPEFEALLMSRPDIQRDEKWAWLWNSSSIGGVYYRWRLWEILTSSATGQNLPTTDTQVLFEGQSVWQTPEEVLNFEYTTELDGFVSDDDYNSSDEESDDGRGGDLARRYNDHKVPGTATDDMAKDGLGYLNPLAKAKLVHLLTRLPDTNAKLRKGDVARLTAFAIEHAGSGGEEVATLVTRNVVKPFSQPSGDDCTPSSMVGLYIISDILSSSASAGVRHAWRYRTLFENALRQQKVFEKLGRSEKDLKWGKLKGEKWKRSVQNMLSLWEGWSVFPQATQEHFVESFMNPPLTDGEQRTGAEAESEAKKREDDDASKTKVMNRWRSVEDEHAAAADVNMDDVDGMPMVDDDDEVMESSLGDLDGVSMIDSSDEDDPPSEGGMAFSNVAKSQPDAVADSAQDKAVPISIKTKPPTRLAQTMPTPGGRRQRPKAADMFADESD